MGHQGWGILVRAALAEAAPASLMSRWQIIVHLPGELMGGSATASESDPSAAPQPSLTLGCSRQQTTSEPNGGGDKKP